MSENRKENKMGTMPIPKLLVSMALPMIISMTIQAMYNVIDSIFVSKINENALTAVSLAFPVQSLMIAVAAGTGVGINALLSKNLGEKNYQSANDTAKNGMFLAIISCIVMAVIGLIGSKPFFLLQTKDAQIVSYGSSYLTIITVLSVGVFLQITLERLLQATGKAFYTMITQGIGAIINIILDPILIFGMFGLPRLEVAGAAIATIIGQVIAVLISLYLNVAKNKEIDINMKGFRPNKHIIRSIYAVGFPSIIMQSIGSIMVFGFNKILLDFSSTAAAVFGVYFKLQSFIFMPVFGLTNGLIPIVAFNYGARNKQRILHATRLSVIVATFFMIIGILLFQLIPNDLLGLFDASPQMESIGVIALRIISIHFIFAGFNIISGAVFQALGNGYYSLIVSVARQLVVILPAAYLLARFLGLNAVWWSFVLAELVSSTLNVIMFRTIKREKLDSL